MFRRFALMLLLSLLVSCGGATTVKSGAASVEVYKHDGSLQCQPDSGVALDSMAQTLTDAGIDVRASRQGNDCLVRPAVCGAGTSVINIYQISDDQLSPAQA
jgi:hypothetical protein